MISTSYNQRDLRLAPPFLQFRDWDSVPHLAMRLGTGKLQPDLGVMLIYTTASG